MKFFSMLGLLSLILFNSSIEAGRWFWQNGPHPTNSGLEYERQYIVDKERTYHTNMRERKCSDASGNRKPFKLTREITEYPDGQMYDKGYGGCLEVPTAYETNTGPGASRIPNPDATWHYPRKHFMGDWYSRNTGPHGKVLKYWVQPLDAQDKTRMGNV